MIREPVSTIPSEIGSTGTIGTFWETVFFVNNEVRNSQYLRKRKRNMTFDESSFQREYESVWAGASEDAFFNPEVFDHNRRLNQPEKEYSGRASKNAYYVVSVDVGRKSDNTAVTIIKVTPQTSGSGNSVKNIVNLYAYEKMHMEDQCINIKKLYFKYNARALVVDGGGLGIGLLDYLVKNQTDPDTGELIPNFGVMNDDDNTYKIYKNEDTILDAIFVIKANPAINTEMHMNAKSQLDANKVKFLIDERTAKEKLLSKKIGQEMTIEQKNEYLRPFTMTSILKEEMMNLVEKNEGPNIKLEKVNTRMKKDKFSSLEMGLYYIRKSEEKKRKKKMDFKKMMLFN